jgi:hypothetical protein
MESTATTPPSAASSGATCERVNEHSRGMSNDARHTSEKVRARTYCI